MEAKLVRGLQRALADGRLDMDTVGDLDLKELAGRLASRSEAMEQRQARISRWMLRLNRRLRRVESRLAVVAGRAADQQEAIRMICSILQDRDDPDGFGLSLDERLAYDEPDQPADGGPE
jgi:hypothetical protein